MHSLIYEVDKEIKGGDNKNTECTERSSFLKVNTSSWLSECRKMFGFNQYKYKC
jgi:hypothetical protein